MTPEECGCCFIYERVFDKWKSDYYLLLDALVDAIVELQGIVADLRKEVDLWHPQKPYRHDLLCDISVCFEDYNVAKEYPDLFRRLN